MSFHESPSSSSFTIDGGLDIEDGSLGAEDSPSVLKRRRSFSDVSIGVPRKKLPHNEEIHIKVVSASYGPCEGRQHQGHAGLERLSCVPLTRDVTPFLRALLIARDTARSGGGSGSDDASGEISNDSPMASSTFSRTESAKELIRWSKGQRTAAGNVIRLMEGKSMNSVFGDPCPGYSKRLHVHYLLFEPDSPPEVHRVSFAEHERVVFRKNVKFYQDDSNWKHAITATVNEHDQSSNLNDASHQQDEYNSALRRARRMGRAQSISEFEESLNRPFPTTPTGSRSQLWLPPSPHQMGRSPGRDLGLPPRIPMPPPPATISTVDSQRKWRLRSAVSEMVVPMVLPFLKVRERVQCQLVCKTWGFVVRNWGVAQSVDIHDPAFPKFSRSFLRGILAHSHHSLQSLNLNDFDELRKEDLHPALPHLRKLASLDISRCHQLDDTTLHLIASHLDETLRILYLKGLRKVSDEGVISVSNSCSELEVLEISYIPVTDASGVSIGENLRQLRALYMRDNYKLTNKSVDVITQNCSKLTQLTLWGCTRLRHLSFDRSDADHVAGSACGNLVVLNLWGCHSLADDAADALADMHGLRSLIASECHRLTDKFLFGLTCHVPNLHHLNLRYCKKITDDGVNAIANNMENLYSLDLSFCTRITSASIRNLLEVRYDMLAELRLQNCAQLDMVRDPRPPDGFPRNTGDGQTGRILLNVLRSVENPSSLSMLDVRNCGGHISPNELYPDEEPFVQGLKRLRFAQKIPGVFVRPTLPNEEVLRRLVEQILL